MHTTYTDEHERQLVADLERAEHKILRDEFGLIVSYAVDDHDGPICCRCGKWWCRNCNGAIESCPGGEEMSIEELKSLIIEDKLT